MVETFTAGWYATKKRKKQRAENKSSFLFASRSRIEVISNALCMTADENS